MIVSLSSLARRPDRRLPRPALADVHDRRAARLRARARHRPAKGRRSRCSSPPGSRSASLRPIAGSDAGPRADRRRDDAVGPRGGRRDPRRRAPARLRRDAFRRLPAAPARARRARAGRRLVVPRRLLPRRDRLHELDLAAHRRPGCCERATSTSTTRRPRGRSLPVVLEAIAGLPRERGRQHRPRRATAARSPRRAAVSLARERLADLLGAETPDELIFTKNATEALNLAILGLAADGAPRS